jgi:curli biogenesis system outer membrane secretion channel CsgG
MKRTWSSSRVVLGVGALGFATLLGCSNQPTYEGPSVENSPSTQALKKLPRKPGERVAVAIYEFRSSVGEVAARGGTDMFVTALVRSGQFRVVERLRVNEGVVREKQLNGTGLATGQAARKKLRGARYIFEGTITEASSSQTQRSTAVDVAGMEVGGGTNRDAIGIDVRLIDVATGEIVDAVSVRKPIRSDSMNVSGVGNLLSTMLGRHGVSSPYTPDAKVTQDRRESIDAALRAAINQAVIVIASRFGS